MKWVTLVAMEGEAKLTLCETIEPFNNKNFIDKTTSESQNYPKLMFSLRKKKLHKLMTQF